jgi:hypothetical protein
LLSWSNTDNDSVAVAGIFAGQFADDITRIQLKVRVENVAHPIMPERLVLHQVGI